MGFTKPIEDPNFTNPLANFSIMFSGYAVGSADYQNLVIPAANLLPTNGIMNTTQMPDGLYHIAISMNQPRSGTSSPSIDGGTAEGYFGYVQQADPTHKGGVQCFELYLVIDKGIGNHVQWYAVGSVYGLVITFTYKGPLP